MSTPTMIALIAALSGLGGVVSGLVMARYTWRKDKREDVQTDIDKASADDKASDRLIELLKEQNRLALENAKYEYEQKLQAVKREEAFERDKMRASLMLDIDARIQAAVDAALDKYGCENAPECENHRPRKHPDASI